MHRILSYIALPFRGLFRRLEAVDVLALTVLILSGLFAIPWLASDLWNQGYRVVAASFALSFATPLIIAGTALVRRRIHIGQVLLVVVLTVLVFVFIGFGIESRLGL